MGLRNFCKSLDKWASPVGLGLMIILNGTGCLPPGGRSSAHQPLTISGSITIPKTAEHQLAALYPYYLLSFKPRFKGERFPLLLVLHGRGVDPRNYFELWRQEAVKHRWMVLVPAYEKPNTNLSTFDFFLEKVVQKHPVDTGQLYVAGASAGALIVRGLVSKNPSQWKGAVLIASPPLRENPGQPGDYPPFLFVHGSQDTQFSAESISKEVENFRAQGIQTELFLYPDAGHEHRPEWNERIFKWLLQVAANSRAKAKKEG